MIGAVIGPGGKVIQEIQAETNSTITIEEIDNVGLVSVRTNPLAEGLAVDLALFGIANATSGSRAEGYATGIDGGSGDDTITNHFDSIITLTSDPKTFLASAAGSLEVIPVIPVLVSGADVSSELIAAAIGIQGGGGTDTITNNGTINATSKPLASASLISL